MIRLIVSIFDSGFGVYSYKTASTKFSSIYELIQDPTVASILIRACLSCGRSSAVSGYMLAQCAVPGNRT